MSDQALGPCKLTPYGNSCPQKPRDRAVPLQGQPRGHHDNLLWSIDLVLTGPAKSGHGSFANVATAAFAMPCAHFGDVFDKASFFLGGHCAISTSAIRARARRTPVASTHTIQAK